MTVTLKLDRDKMSLGDDTDAQHNPLYFDFTTINNVMNDMAITPLREQLQFELRLVHANGDTVHVSQMGTFKKRPEQLLLTRNDTRATRVTASVLTRAKDPSPRRRDSVVFHDVIINSGVSSRCLHTESKKFAFQVLPSNVNAARWEAYFPGCKLPHALSNSFFVSTSRAPQIQTARSNLKRRLHETEHCSGTAAEVASMSPLA